MNTVTRRRSRHDVAAPRDIVVTLDDQTVVIVAPAPDVVVVPVTSPPPIVLPVLDVGPPGPSVVSTDPNNYARLGSDTFIHVPIAVGPTPPAAPFTGMLWIDTT